MQTHARAREIMRERKRALEREQEMGKRQQNRERTARNVFLALATSARAVSLARAIFVSIHTGLFCTDTGLFGTNTGLFAENYCAFLEM